MYAIAADFSACYCEHACNFLVRHNSWDVQVPNCSTCLLEVDLHFCCGPYSSDDCECNVCV